MKKYTIIIVVAFIFIANMYFPAQIHAQVFPMGFINPPPYAPVNPYFLPISPVLPPPSLIPPLPVRQAAQTTLLTVALPPPVVATAPLPVVPAPIISTTQLFLGLLLSIGEESGLFYTNPALFWYIVGLLY
ncbi:MAG: hypothetical protein ACMUJM_14755 [bacterium]